MDIEAGLILYLKKMFSSWGQAFRNLWSQQKEPNVTRRPRSAMIRDSRSIARQQRSRMLTSEGAEGFSGPPTMIAREETWTPRWWEPPDPWNYPSTRNNNLWILWAGMGIPIGLCNGDQGYKYPLLLLLYTVNCFGNTVHFCVLKLLSQPFPTFCSGDRVQIPTNPLC